MIFSFPHADSQRVSEHFGVHVGGLRQCARCSSATVLFVVADTRLNHCAMISLGEKGASSDHLYSHVTRTLERVAGEARGVRLVCGVDLKVQVRPISKSLGPARSTSL